MSAYKIYDRSSPADWPIERITRLRFLWQKGTTPKTIAEEFQLSIFAIEAKAAHLGLGDQPRFRPEIVTPPPNCRTLSDDSCVWPVEREGRMGFCGDTRFASKPYCEEHAKRAYVRVVKTAVRKHLY